VGQEKLEVGRLVRLGWCVSVSGSWVAWKIIILLSSNVQ
jgi:hypothetical protein